MENKHRRRLLKLLGCGLVILLSFAVMGFIALYLIAQAVKGVGDAFAPDVSEFQREHLKEYVGVNLPDEATNFHGIAYSFMQSRIIAIRFDIPPSRIDYFLNQLGLQESLDNLLNPFIQFSFPVREWWKPNQAKSYAGANWTKPETFFDVMVDKTNPEQYILYLMVEQG